MYDKKGTKYTYGSDDTGRMYDTSTGTSTKTYKWMLQEIRDTNGNFTKYSYNRDNNELYPYKITYTGNGSTDGPFTVSFATSTRTDTRVSYAAGFVSTTTKRISQITAAINGTNVRQYLLSYGTGNNGYRSLLTGLGQRGWDDNGIVTTMPTTTLSYLNSSAQFLAPAPCRLANASFVPADLNGNGVNDILTLGRNNDGSYTAPICLDGTASSPGSVTQPGVYWAKPIGNGDTWTPIEQGIRTVDADGDGKADIVQGVQNNPGPTYISNVFINTYSTTTGAYSLATSTSYAGTIPTTAIIGPGSVQTTGIWGDVNGDGVPDFEQWINGVIGPSGYVGNGSAWDGVSPTFQPAKDFPASGGSATASQLVDINGDGLDDWVYSDGTNTYVLLNNGTGWNSSPSSQWTIATSTLYQNGATYYDRGIRFMDLNGDGLIDFVRAYQNAGGTGCSGPEIADVKAVYLNTGNGWATSTAYTLPAYITYCSGGPSSHMTNNEYVNFNGNGQQNQDVLSSIINSHGGLSTVLYSPSATTTTNLNPELPVSLLTVTAVGQNDGQGNISTTSYAYQGGKLYLASGVRDKKFAGFQISTTTAPDSITASYYDQGDAAYTIYGEQSDGYGQINHPFRKDILDTSGNIKQRTYFRWDTITHGSSTFVALGRQVVWDYASDGSHRDKATDYQYSSTTDDLIKTIE
jgi:hypothetical protein